MANTPSQHTRYLIYKPDDSSRRLVIVISKKVARTAVQRNKFRRWIRELAYLKTRKKYIQNNTTQLRGVIIVKRDILNAGFHDLVIDFTQLLERL